MATNAADRAELAAQEAVLANADTFADWLCGEVGDKPQPTQLLNQVKGDRTPEDFTTTPVGNLYRLAIDRGQRAPIRLAALDAINERYLKAKDGYVRRLALESLEAA